MKEKVVGARIPASVTVGTLVQQIKSIITSLATKVLASAALVT